MHSVSVCMSALTHTVAHDGEFFPLKTCGGYFIENTTSDYINFYLLLHITVTEMHPSPKEIKPLDTIRYE